MDRVALSTHPQTARLAIFCTEDACGAALEGGMVAGLDTVCKRPGQHAFTDGPARIGAIDEDAIEARNGSEKGAVS